MNFLKGYWYLLHSYNVMNFTTILDMSNDFRFFQKQSFGSFDVLLTVHLSIFILVINQIDAKNFVLQ